MKKILLLVNSKDKYFWKFAEKSEKIDIEEAYKKKFSSKLCNQIRRRNAKWVYYYHGILNSWKYQLNKYNKIIIIDSAYSKQIDFFLKFYKGKAYFFMWNKLDLDYERAEVHLRSVYKGLKKYTFNRVDSKEHHIKFNSTMYIPNRKFFQISDEERQRVEYDIIFIGLVVRNRIEQLDFILDMLAQRNISFYVYGVDDEKNKGENIRTNNYILHDKYMPYDQYLEMLMGAKAVLDIAKYGNEYDGISLRAMESIFYRKKFITTNPQVKEEKFYDKRNVFIIGEDDESILKDFIMAPYEEIPQEVQDYYLVENWVDRFE